MQQHQLPAHNTVPGTTMAFTGNEGSKRFTDCRHGNLGCRQDPQVMMRPNTSEHVLRRSDMLDNVAVINGAWLSAAR